MFVIELLNKYKLRPDRVAVGVSGGADSLFLALATHDELQSYGIKTVALTVNHKLRPEADVETQYVQEIMQQYGIEHHVLVWQGEKPQTGIEEKAREARYDLLCRWCKDNGIDCLLIAHHLRDQAETFLMRLQRGSGLEGLCSMREMTEINSIKILRPLLHIEPAFCENYLSSKKIKWVHDNSNDNTDFLRVKMREFLPELQQKTGIDLAKFDEAIVNLQSADDYISEQVEKEIKDKVRNDFDAVISFKYSDFIKWHKELKFRILALLLKKKYIPRAQSILELISAMQTLPFTGATLGGKEIFLNYGRVWIVPELSAKRRSTRKEWKEFLLANSEYQNQKIPHKARLAILQKSENIL